MAHVSDLIATDIEQYLKSHEKKSLLRFITCGSVDDGKSTLIGRLLYESKMLFEDQLAAVEADSKKWGTQGDQIDFALLVDGLAAEREQGITIDVAYRFFSTDKRKFIVADTPGHEQYTRNMVTGASTADAAIILIDARKGVLTQTRRHSKLASLVGIPHLVVNFFINKRTNAFVSKFPDALELLVRGLRSGLPVTETLGVVAQEVPGPVGLEFRGVVDRIKVGKTMEDALQDTGDRLGIPEFNFFTITLAIQRETGGNLAETLSNLADVLRKRGQMKLKIKAMSSESKASAYIVGALPFIVFTMIYWINPNYLGGFFTDDRLIVTGLGGLVWMGIGAFIMAKMVSFEI